LFAASTVLLFACGKLSNSSPSTTTAIMNHDPGLNIETKLSDTDANGYVASLLRNPNGIRSQDLNLGGDFSKTNFSNTPVAKLPIAKYILDQNGYVIPGKMPVVSAYRIESLMDTSDKAMQQMKVNRGFDSIGSESFTLNAIRLNYTDQYYYQAKVPEVGYIAEGFSSTNQITDINGKVLYKDVIGYETFPNPRNGLALQASFKQEPLPSLPQSMRSDLQLNTQNEDNNQKIYWFQTPSSIKRIIVSYEGNDSFRDLFTERMYRFSNVDSSVQSISGNTPGIVFNGRHGKMSEVNSQ
jgi:hypothetical protein